MDAKFFPRISYTPFKTHSHQAKANIFFDVCRLFFDLFSGSLIFFTFALAFVRCDRCLKDNIEEYILFLTFFLILPNKGVLWSL